MCTIRIPHKLRHHLLPTSERRPKKDGQISQFIWHSNETIISAYTTYHNIGWFQRPLLNMIIYSSDNDFGTNAEYIVLNKVTNGRLTGKNSSLDCSNDTKRRQDLTGCQRQIRLAGCNVQTSLNQALKYMYVTGEKRRTVTGGMTKVFQTDLYSLLGGVFYFQKERRKTCRTQLSSRRICVDRSVIYASSGCKGNGIGIARSGHLRSNGDIRNGLCERSQTVGSVARTKCSLKCPNKVWVRLAKHIWTTLGKICKKDKGYRIGIAALTQNKRTTEIHVSATIKTAHEILTCSTKTYQRMNSVKNRFKGSLTILFE